jgi:signal transduction histidine kinase/Flp pilus assembly protein TadD
MRTKYIFAKIRSLKFLLTLLIFAICSISFGQKQLLIELDSLKKSIRQSTYYDSTIVFNSGQRAIQIAKKLKKPSEEAIIYQYYGNFYFFSTNIKKSKYYYEKSIEIAKTVDDKKLINSTKIRLTFILLESDLIAAERSFQELLKEALDNKFIENSVEIYNGLGNLYDVRQMKDEAMNYYLKGLKIADKENKSYLNAMMLNNIGLLKFNNGQTQEAEKDFKEALEKIEGLNEDRLGLNLNNNLGLVNKELKDYEQSIKYYQNTVVNAQKLGFPLGRGVAFLNLSDSYFNNKAYSKAQTYLDSAAQILKTSEQWDYFGMTYLIQANIYIGLNKLELAKIQIDSLFNLHNKYPNTTNVMNGHDVLSTIYEKQGNFKLAFFHAARYHKLNDSISEIANKDNLAQLQVIYGKEKVESELENEKNKNSLLSKENELKQTRIQGIIFVAISIIIIGFGLFYIRHVRITRKNQQMFTQKLIENIDHERSRISRDLHDDIGQSLSVIKSKINLFNTGKINGLEGMEKEVGEVIDHTRSISHFLHPSFVAKLGLERSMVSLLEKTESNTGIITSISIKNEIESLDLNTKTQLYRIVQECISNTIKHSKATALKVSLKNIDGEFILKYRDNGIGFKSDKSNSEGIGMLTIRERALTIGGKISLPTSDKGFVLILTIS